MLDLTPEQELSLALILSEVQRRNILESRIRPDEALSIILDNQNTIMRELIRQRNPITYQDHLDKIDHQMLHNINFRDGKYEWGPPYSIKDI